MESLSRRARQRLENPVRAENMHLARMAYENSEIEINPPDWSDEIPVINIGCSGWFYRHWSGNFYPPSIPTSKWFEYYADHLDTVELNSPFYLWPSIATVKTWIRQAKGRQFIYTIKVNELITHTKKFEGTKSLIKDFGFVADLLGPLMGCLLFQLPPSYKYTSEKLDNILSQLDHNRRNVVEFRHSSWWNDDVFAEFKKTGTIFCSCSAPKLPDELIKTAHEIYIRFHGIQQWYRQDYSKEELLKWANRIKESGAKRVWIYFNNDERAYAVKNALELLEELNLNFLTHNVRKRTD
jgi:uncharacterized protein YecE (DUF72 family)